MGVVTKRCLPGGVKLVKTRWPRGKYNGEKIEGFKISLSLRFFTWAQIIPSYSWNYGEPYFIWLCFCVRGYLEYR